MTRAKRHVRARVDRTGRHPPNSFQARPAAQVARRAASATPAQIPMTFRSSILDHSSNPGIRLSRSSGLRDGFRPSSTRGTKEWRAACESRWCSWCSAPRDQPVGIRSKEESRRPGSAGELARNVRPILSDNCFACHGPDDHKSQGGAAARHQGRCLYQLESGTTAIVPGRPDESELVDRIETNDADSRIHRRRAGSN